MAASDSEAQAKPTETIEELRKSFYYGSRSDLNFKFAKDLTDSEFGQFLAELFAAGSQVTDGGDPLEVADVAYRWQVHAYSGHLGDPKDFPHGHDDVPISPLAKPLSESRLTLLTSSGHFVEGDDPKPFGVVDMSQSEAERRITEFIKEAPSLSTIPVDVDPAKLHVRHGGYPVQAVAEDHEVALPIGYLSELASNGTIGDLNANAYSFVGATSQGRLKRDVLPEWIERLKSDETDVVLLIPV